jgi:hypothetical protein
MMSICMDDLLFMSLMQLVATDWTTFTYFSSHSNFYCISMGIYDEANNCSYCPLVAQYEEMGMSF